MPPASKQPPASHGIKILVAKYPQLPWLAAGYVLGIILFSILVVHPTATWWTNALYGVVFSSVSLGFLISILATLQDSASNLPPRKTNDK